MASTGRRAPSRRAGSPTRFASPCIAAINGHAIGVGLTYPLQCDIRFVAADAKLSFAFTRRGVAPELGSHFLLPRIIGFSRAADLLISARTFSGEEAAAIGLASRALPADDVLPTALEYAREIARDCAPNSCALVKELLWSALDLDQSETRRIEIALVRLDRQTRRRDRRRGGLDRATRAELEGTVVGPTASGGPRPPR